MCIANGRGYPFEARCRRGCRFTTPWGQVGQLDAMTMLGFLHASGLAERYGGGKGLDQALLYWTIAAETRNEYATSVLWFRYMHAIGLGKDYETAARYRQAARAIALDGKYWPTP